MIHRGSSGEMSVPLRYGHDEGGPRFYSSPHL